MYTLPPPTNYQNVFYRPQFYIKFFFPRRNSFSFVFYGGLKKRRYFFFPTKKGRDKLQWVTLDGLEEGIGGVMAPIQTKQ